MRLNFAMFLPGGKTEKGIEYVREWGSRREKRLIRSKTESVKRIGPKLNWDQSGPFWGTDSLGSVRSFDIQSVFALPYMWRHRRIFLVREGEREMHTRERRESKLRKRREKGEERDAGRRERHAILQRWRRRQRRNRKIQRHINLFLHQERFCARNSLPCVHERERQFSRWFSHAWENYLPLVKERETGER